MQSHDLEVLAQANAVLTSYCISVIDQLSQMTVTMNVIQAQLEMLAAAPTYQTRSKSKCYFCSWGINYTHGSKTFSSNKSVHQDEACYKKRLGGREKGCEWRLGEAMNKIEIRNPKISLINCINTPPNPTSNNILEIADLGANIHLSKQATTTMSPVIMSN